MRFSTIHKLTSYLVALSALGALLFAPDVPQAVALVTLVAVALSWFAEPSRFRLERYTTAWNVATVVVVLYLVADVLRGGSPINAGAYFLIFLLVNKLFNRRASRDYQQAYVTSFLLLVLATTLNTSLTYAACFVLFVIAATWALTLLHLRREMEENYLLKHSDGAQSEKVEVERILNSRRIVGGRFLGGTSLVSVGVLVIAALIFTFFPRIGFGLFLGLKRGGLTMVGFSDRVQLGQHGTLRDNPVVVMRVVLADGKPAGPLRWRGSAFDHYESGVWSHGPRSAGRFPIAAEDGLYVMSWAPGLPYPVTPRYARQHLTRQEIYLEPLDSTVVFAADRPVALEVPRPAVGGKPFFAPMRGPHDELRGDRMRTAGVRYTAYSALGSPPPALLRRSRTVSDPRWSESLAPLLQIPPSLPRRVGDLARRIAAGKPTLYDRVMAIQDYLRASYRYTVKLTHDPELEPVDEFLFVTRQGHCEYFASAMTLMLRHLGIHARAINGFAGGEWNEVGRYVAVRQGDAHSWVEVLFDQVGWVTFDPTPGGTRPPASTAGRLAQLLDTIRLRWFRYVVEYDLGKQVSLLRGLGELVRPSSTAPSGSWLAARWRPLLVASAALLLGGAILVWRRRRRIRRGSDGERATARRHPHAQHYERLLRLLGRAGHVKPPGLTPLEFVGALEAARFGPVLLVERFTRCYYDSRYGEVEASDARATELGGLLGEIESALRTRRGA